MIPVSALAPRYRAAVAELPRSVVPAESPRDAIVALPGAAGWCARALRALDLGARAVVVADPATEPEREVLALRERAAGRPVVLDRPLLREDWLPAAFAAAAGRTSLLEIALSGPASALAVGAREGAGWLRLLGGGGFEAVSARVVAGGVLALLERGGGAAHGGAAATLTLVATGDEREARGEDRTASAADSSAGGGGAVGAWLRATALGETRVEVVVDASALAVSVELADESGQRRAPRAFETPERAALRRALEALQAHKALDGDPEPGTAAAGSGARDLDGLIADQRLARVILSTAG